MKKVLLVNPDFDPAETRAKALSSKLGSLGFFSARSFIAPLSLATVSALTPANMEVDIWDEAVQGLISEDTCFQKEYSLVGITGYSAHGGRVNRLGRMFRSRGILTAVGGAGVSAEPEEYRRHFDILFIGEAEYTWPRFLSDWEKGKYDPEYRQVEKVSMADSPPPCWDEMADTMKYYLSGAVQTTRGCPFDCEFCDVVHLYGRKVRQKPVAQVLDEISALHRLGVERIFFCDDNFYGNPSYTKALVKELVALNGSFRFPVRFSGQISINVAKDDDLLELMADANFTWLYIGIESPNKESLLESNKRQNYRTDMLADVAKIQSYGMPVRSGMIVGFDHDESSIFEHQFDFLQGSCIPGSALAILKAPPGTKLWKRLAREGRLVEFPSVAGGEGLCNMSASGDCAARGYAISPMTNIIPLRMTRGELYSGYHALVSRVREWRHFEARVRGMISQIRRVPRVKRRRLPWKPLSGFLKFVLFSMGAEGRRVTLKLLVYTWLRASFMLERVIGLIVVQWLETIQVAELRESVNDQLKLESARGTRPVRELKA